MLVQSSAQPFSSEDASGTDSSPRGISNCRRPAPITTPGISRMSAPTSIRRPPHDPAGKSAEKLPASISKAAEGTVKEAPRLERPCSRSARLLSGARKQASGSMTTVLGRSIQGPLSATVVLDPERIPILLVREGSYSEKAVPASRLLRSGDETVRPCSGMSVWPSEMVACASGTEVAHSATVARGFERVATGVGVRGRESVRNERGAATG